MFRLATPRAVFAGAVALVLIVVAVIVIVSIARSGDCHETVDVRNDQRSMWLFALAEAQDPFDPRAVAFRMALDERLPELHCTGWLGGHPEPIGD